VPQRPASHLGKRPLCGRSPVADFGSDSLAGLECVADLGNDHLEGRETSAHSGGGALAGNDGRSDSDRAQRGGPRRVANPCNDPAGLQNPVVTFGNRPSGVPAPGRSGTMAGPGSRGGPPFGNGGRQGPSDGRSGSAEISDRCARRPDVSSVMRRVTTTPGHLHNRGQLRRAQCPRRNPGRPRTRDSCTVVHAYRRRPGLRGRDRTPFVTGTMTRFRFGHGRLARFLF
jgi:hypothetical protein